VSGAITAPRGQSLCLGHEAVEQAFGRARACGRLPHAWLFLGPRGIGKATLAFRLTRELLAKPDELPHDPQSAVFRQVAHATHPDLHVLERRPHPRTGRMQTEIVIDSVREVIEELHKTAAWDGARVLLIDPIDELNRNAENALLKLLEEPAAGIVIFLICHNQGSVPRTILSRCALMRLRPPPAVACETIVRTQRPDIEPTWLARLGALTSGSPGRMIEAHDSDLLAHYDALLTACCQSGPAASRALELSESFAKLASASNIRRPFELIATLAVRAAKSAAGSPPDVAITPDEPQRLQALTQNLPYRHWLHLWSHLAGLPEQVEGLNLDARMSLFLSLRALMGEGIEQLEI